MREASKRLAESLFDSYENDWAGEEDLGAIVEVSVILCGKHFSFLAAVVQKQQNPPLARGRKPISLPHPNALLTQYFCCAFLIRERTSCGLITR